MPTASGRTLVARPVAGVLRDGPLAERLALASILGLPARAVITVYAQCPLSHTLLTCPRTNNSMYKVDAYS